MKKKKISIQINNHKIEKFKKKITVALDKSITHRCLFISANCIGISKIKGLVSEDIDATINGLRLLGIKIIKKKNIYFVHGNGISGFRKFNGEINCGNSGTSARSFLGLLACYPYKVTINGDKSLMGRPFKRLTKYLEKVGANIDHPKNKKKHLPIEICGTKSWPLAQRHYMTAPSAQIKTSLLYSALQTLGNTEIIETPTRDHAEIILKQLGADIKIKKIKNKNLISLKGQKEMKSFSINVPGDPSSACYFVVQTLLTKNSELLIKNICINKNRIGFIKILRDKMKGKIKIINKKKIFGEEVGDLFVKSSNLRPINCSKEVIVSCIDDLPIIWIACALTKGQSKFSSIAELRLKESDRIRSISEGMKAFGIKTESTKDSIKIYGNPEIKTKKKIIISSKMDHRIAMSFFIFGQIIGANLLIKGFETVKSSFPDFLKLQKHLGAKYEIKKK